MKLLISVVNRDDLYGLTEALVRGGYDATVVSTTGGFLREGNATLVIGVADEGVDEVLGLINDTCRARTRYVNPFPLGAESEEAYAFAPVEVEVGGAVVFIAAVSQFERF
jgi:uncharacterized protein YaaQ